MLLRYPRSTSLPGLRHEVEHLVTIGGCWATLPHQPLQFLMLSRGWAVCSWNWTSVDRTQNSNNLNKVLTKRKCAAQLCPHFCFPREAPARIVLYITWIEVPLNAFKMPRSTYASTFNSLRYSAFNNDVTLKPGLGVVQGHWKWYHKRPLVWFPIQLL